MPLEHSTSQAQAVDSEKQARFRAINERKVRFSGESTQLKQPAQRKHFRQLHRLSQSINFEKQNGYYLLIYDGQAQECTSHVHIAWDGEWKAMRVVTWSKPTPDHACTGPGMVKGLAQPHSAQHASALDR
jgi:hypothetical protein